MAPPSKRQLKLIEDVKSRNVTFEKRKEGLKKKAYQLATLCGIQLMMIIYGPKGTVDTWPAEPHQVKDVIKRYEKVQGGKGEVSLDLHDYFKEQIKKKESQLLRLSSSQKGSVPNIEAMMALAQHLDSRIDAVNDRINALIASHEIGFEHNYSRGALHPHQFLTFL